jgi:hypothetical protein
MQTSVLQATKKVKYHIGRGTEAPQNTSQPEISSPSPIALPLHRTPSSHAYCFICKRPSPELIVASSSARCSAFLHMEIIIPHGSRCCPTHIEDDEFTLVVLDNLQTFDSSLVNRATILELISEFRHYAIQNSTCRFSFEPSKMNSDAYQTLTGISKENF